MIKKPGKFITFEGGEGCGKTTQVTRFADFLRSKGLEVLETKQPGGTPIGRKIREIVLHPGHHQMQPACEALLYLADRAQHVHQVLRPALEKGQWVVCDRYQDSTVVYQGIARGLGRTELDRIFNITTGGLQPDLTILLDMDPKLALARALQRNNQGDLGQREGRFEAEPPNFHQTVREFFLTMAQGEPDRFAVVDAAPGASIVAQNICNLVQERLFTSV